MPTFIAGGHKYECGCELIDVTRFSRPDTSWKHTDMLGHVHQWFLGDEPAMHYLPMGMYSTPTLVWVIDEISYDEWGEEHEMGHHECRECGQKIEPRYKADEYKQFATGPQWYKIDNQLVSRETFENKLNELRSKQRSTETMR